MSSFCYSEGNFFKFSESLCAHHILRENCIETNLTSLLHTLGQNVIRLCKFDIKIVLYFEIFALFVLIISYKLVPTFKVDLFPKLKKKMKGR